MAQRNAWVPFIVFIPLIYILGWLLIQPFSFLGIDISTIQLLGTILSFTIFLLLLPSWSKVRWNHLRVFSFLGVTQFNIKINLRTFFKGVLFSTLIILFIVIILTLGGWVTWTFEVTSLGLLNAVFLCLFVGFAEEVIFRGWLLTELNQMLGRSRSVFIQAFIFSFLHMRTSLGLLEFIGLFIGLFLLGLALALRRFLDRSSIWGCVGLHGGLVSIWYLLSQEFIDLNSIPPSFLFGPGGTAFNPIGGIFSILILVVIIYFQRDALPIADRPSRGAFNESSNGETP